MKKIGDKYTNNIFENIKHIDENLESQNTKLKLEMSLSVSARK